MESLDYWRLCDEFSIIQAALLIIGHDPDDANYIEGWEFCNRPQGYEATKTALKGAIHSKHLQANVNSNIIGTDYDSNNIPIAQYALIDLHNTTVKFSDLKNWLSKKNIKAGFFFESNDTQPNYLNKNDANYSLKLAAAIDVWEALSENPALIKRGSPKQAILKWLRLHAAKYNLTKDDGSPNEQGIEDIAKVVNWQTKGGAPKTPISKNLATNSQ